MSLQPRYKRIQWAVLLFAGVLGFGFAYMFLDASLTLAARGSSLSGIVVFSLFSALFFLLGVVDIALMYGFRYGEVSEVGGSLGRPLIVKNGHVVDVKSRIIFSNSIDAENLDLLPEQKQVVFLCGWRFWVCPLPSCCPSR